LLGRAEGAHPSPSEGFKKLILAGSGEVKSRWGLKNLSWAGTRSQKLQMNRRVMLQNFRNQQQRREASGESSILVKSRPPPPVEDRPQATSTLKKGNLGKEDKPNKPIPKEAERAADRLLYGTPKATGSEAGTVKDQQDPGGVEWVVQWTYGTVQRLVAKLNIEVARWEEYPPEEIKESHWYSEKPKTEYLKTVFGEYIIRDRDFRMFTRPICKWMDERSDSDSHHEEVQRDREKWKKMALRAARPEPAARPPPKTTLEQDVEDEAQQRSTDREFKKKMEKAPRLKRPKRK
jgi:hypothetical protein